MFLSLRLALGSVLLFSQTPDSPPGTLDFSKEQNSALLILLEDI